MANLKLSIVFFPDKMKINKKKIVLCNFENRTHQDALIHQISTLIIELMKDTKCIVFPLE